MSTFTAQYTDDEKRWQVLAHYLVGPSTVVLRSYFLSIWQSVYGQAWVPSDSQCCVQFYNSETAANWKKPCDKRFKLDPVEWVRLQTSSDTADWDFCLVCKILLFSDLCHQYSIPAVKKMAIKALRDSRNLLFGHIKYPSLTHDKFLIGVNETLASLNQLGANISAEERNQLLQAASASSYILTNEQVSSLVKQHAHGASPAGRLEMWLTEFFNSPIPTPITLKDPTERGSDMPTPMGAQKSDGTLSSFMQVPCIWFTVSCNDEDGKSAAIMTPCVGIDADLTIGYDAKLRSALKRNEVPDEVSAGEKKSWLLGVADGDLSKRHCRIFYEGGEWRVALLDNFEAKVSRRRNHDAIKDTVVFGTSLQLLDHDEIVLNSTHRLMCHVRTGDPMVMGSFEEASSNASEEVVAAMGCVSVNESVATAASSYSYST